MIAYIEHRETIAATGIATWDVTVPDLHLAKRVKSDADIDASELKREVHRILSPLIDGTFMVEFYKPVIIPSETPMTPAARIQSRIDETQIEINTVNGECRSRVRHLQRKLQDLKTPHDVTHELILEVISVGESLRDALSEKSEHVKKIELLRELRNEELAAKLT